MLSDGRQTMADRKRASIHTGWKKINQVTLTSGGSEDSVAACLYSVFVQQMLSLCHGTTAHIHHFLVAKLPIQNSVWSPWKRLNVAVEAWGRALGGSAAAKDDSVCAHLYLLHGGGVNLFIKVTSHLGTKPQVRRGKSITFYCRVRHVVVTVKQ